MGILLRIFLLAFGLLCLGLSAGIVAMGPQFIYEQASQLIGMTGDDFTAFGAPFVDGTVRFLAMFFVIFSLIVLNVARDYNDNYALIPLLMIIMILAGCARLWGIYSHVEHSSFSFMAIMVEILPAIFILMLYFIAGKRDRY